MNLLHELIIAQASRTPEDTAVVFEGESLTYAELDRRSARLAHRLRELGAGPDVLVGVLLERSVGMIVGILAILRSGGAYVPIDAGHPPERVALILEDAGVGVVLTDSSLLPIVPRGIPHVVNLDAFDWEFDVPVAGPADVRPADLAYVIYTSGSTGRPKGVCVEHRQIVHYVRAISERFRFEPRLQHATVSTIAADLGHTVVFPALATGGCLHVVSQTRASNQALLAEYFERERIDVLKIVPSHLAALQTGPDPHRVMPRRTLILGGEASRLDWVGRLRALAPSCDIHNHYGPTETTVGVLTCRVDRSPARTESGTVPLGCPLPDSSIYIVDAGGRPVRDGEQGELWVGGAGVARGYRNRPDLTAEKFIPDPFTAGADRRVYRTGDLVCRLPDGQIEFLGRIDSQIKLHGNRIEPAEIEHALRGLDGVREAVVFARADESGERQLVACLVPDRIEQPLWNFPTVHLLPDGSPVAHLNRNETDYIYNEIFLLQAYLRHGITIRDGDCIVDAGANIGLFTVFASRRARDLHIVAIEPNPAAFACLAANASSCGASVRCLPTGLSHENTSAQMTAFEGLSLLSGFYADAAVEREVVRHYVINGSAPLTGDQEPSGDLAALIDERLRARTVTAQLRTLSSVIADEGIARIDLLKINVEKSELDVLRGLREDDWLKIRQLVIEVDREQHLDAITALLAAHGFDVLVEQDPLLERTELRYVYARHPALAGRLVRGEPTDAHRVAVGPADEHVLTPAALRARLKRRLPGYMIPSAFVLLPELPLTANGKIDRQALHASAAGPIAAADRCFTPPGTETETTLAAIWCDVLHVAQVGIHDDFFDLGGQSLTAIKTVARIRDAFNVTVSLRHLFEQPTVAGLSGIIDGLWWTGHARLPVQGQREDLTL